MPLYDDDDSDGRTASPRRHHEDNEDEYDFRKRQPPRSGLGIASCVLALLAVLTGAIAMAMPSPLLAALAIYGAGFLCLTGAALAVAGLLQRDHNKHLAVIGLCLNALLLFCGLGLIMAPLLAG